MALPLLLQRHASLNAPLCNWQTFTKVGLRTHSRCKFVAGRFGLQEGFCGHDNGQLREPAFCSFFWASLFYLEAAVATVCRGEELLNSRTAKHSVFATGMPVLQFSASLSVFCI